MRMNETGKMLFKYPEFELTRTQDFEELFHDAGQFYFGRTTAWLSNKKMHTDGVGIEIPSHQVVDIDTLEDWERAELLYKTIAKNRLEIV
jgi:CMP-N-acetylneuraminic acid synthetase